MQLISHLCQNRDVEQDAKRAVEALKEYLLELITFSEDIKIYAREQLIDELNKIYYAIQEQVDSKMEFFENIFDEIKEYADESGEHVLRCILGERYIKTLGQLLLEVVTWELKVTSNDVEKELIPNFRNEIESKAKLFRNLEKHECKDNTCFYLIFLKSQYYTLSVLPDEVSKLCSGLLEELRTMVETSRKDVDATSNTYLEQITNLVHIAFQCFEIIVSKAQIDM